MSSYASSSFEGNGAIQAQDEQSRRLQTSLRTQSGTFDQAVAVSQKSLNDALYYLFDQYEELRSIKVRSFVGELDATMQYSEISLPVNENNYSTVVFYCHFETGSLRLKDDEGKLGDNIDVADWRFAFDVDFGSIDVPSNTSEYQDLKKKLSHPGEYDIRRLFLDFKTNKINHFKEKLSDFNGHNWKDDDEKLKFVFLMSAWGNSDQSVMKDEKLSTLGYAISTNRPQSVNPLGPTFPPTSLKHQHYKYLAPGKDTPEVGLEKGGNNMLLYLEMTQNRSFPQEDILTYSGNFCAANMEATTCISHDNFWDAYLLRNTALDGSELPGLLREFNYQLYAWQGDLELTVGNDGSYELDWSFGIGHNSPEAPKNSASHYAWTRTSATNWDFKWPPPQSHADWTSPAETVNKLSINPGDNKILIGGYSKLWIKLHHWFIGSEDWHEGSVTVTWNTEIEMKSVKEGGLEMQLKMPTNPKDLFKIDYTPKSVFSSSKEGPGMVVPDLKSAAEDAITKVDFNTVTTTLQNSLKSSARFVLPGGRVFHYKDPIFNDNGDLLVEGFYKN
ncbi:hypothetical protein P168DRAFT_279802 [Aspergillus campestris IBT 28561]|uniref:Uncharacterized protein n=1 Tax=Aspergillus campestris (strain IBT 28561) TaxID=1392248 RepID=A0A2I1D921_ASPC2|nr:uncharacterized protein P168DRAFT_279802 [Aspergillus campestris IBT 28561]PKY06357.1 hypothetical protein P168DRAFT_279802 [Aspergillus campestris IBT 28561]